MRKYIALEKKWSLIALFLVIACSFGFGRSSAAEKCGGYEVLSSYVIRSLGSDIGTVSAKMSGTPDDNDLRADVDVNVGVWFFSFSLKSSETTGIRAGKTVRYRKTIDTGSKHREITGELDGGTLIIVIREGEKVERKVFSAMSYEATNMEYPEVTLAPGEVRKMRVLDLENAEIVERVYRFVAEEHADIAGRPTRVIVADIADENAEFRRRTAIINGLPVVIRQEGKEKTGLFNPAYSVRQTKVAVHS